VRGRACSKDGKEGESFDFEGNRAIGVDRRIILKLISKR
jgi:hypothetical protein